VPDVTFMAAALTPNGSSVLVLTVERNISFLCW